MNFKEYGDKNNKTIMLLHGGGLSWWNYREEAELLKEKYHVILPILDGHADSDRGFTSIEDNAQEIIDFINENYNGHICFIGGLSLGAQVLVEMLSRKSDVCDYAIIESALVKPLSTASKVVKPSIKLSYKLISKKWFAELQFASLKIRKDLFDDYYRDSCKIKKEDLIAFLAANVRYTVKDTIKDTKAKVLIVVGRRENFPMINSAKILNEKIKGSTMKILPGYYHGGFSLNNPTQYIGAIYGLIGSNE